MNSINKIQIIVKYVYILSHTFIIVKAILAFIILFTLTIVIIFVIILRFNKKIQKWTTTRLKKRNQKCQL